MRLRTCNVSNFGSYANLSLDFTDLGLSLVYGQTGSGKSTIPDAPFWILFGETAKQGNADEVRSWNAPDAPTQGTLTVDFGASSSITVTRIRGKSNQNDLYWTEGSGDTSPQRGKDISDTQKLLNQRLGITSDLYATAAYSSEFSPATTFFMANAKKRRELFERIAPLELPQRLAEQASTARATEKKRMDAYISKLQNLMTSYEAYLQQVTKYDREIESWNVKHRMVMEGIAVQSVEWDEAKDAREADRKAKHEAWTKDHNAEYNALQSQLTACVVLMDRLSSLEAQKKAASLCETCSHPMVENQDDLLAQIAEAKAATRDHQGVRTRLARHIGQKNPYEAQPEGPNPHQQRLDQELHRPNPFISMLATAREAIGKTSYVLNKTAEACEVAERTYAGLNQLYDLSYDLRGTLLQGAVSEVESGTNAYMERFFDAEIRVSLSMVSADDLDVQIYKNGHACVYRQLSKGQRALLRLCFGVAVMKSASNHSGVHFADLMFDESLDGLDESLKVKAFGLFETLAQEHESVILIDHAASFQNLFRKRFHVTMEADVSHLESEDE